MTVQCLIYLLDGSEVEFEIGKNAKAYALLDLVCLHLNVMEKDYFGLKYRGSPLQNAWLSPDKKIKKQVNKGVVSKLEFDFAVKFYPTQPTKLKEEITRYLICLQIRRDLATHLDCSVDKLTHLLSYWLQSEYEGKNDHAKAVKDCMKNFKTPPSEATSAEFVERVLSLYRSRDGMSSSDADNQFLATAAGLRTYGVHFYKGKETSNADVHLGISSKGVVEKREGQAPVSHSWSRIKNIVYKNRKFKVKLLRAPPHGDPRLKKTFIFENESQVHSIWKTAVDHHVFFRVGEKDKKPRPPSDKKPKKRSSLLRRFSSKKKKPKTEMDAQQESETINRRQPTVTRASSLRRSASLRMSVTSSSSESIAQPTTSGVQVGGVTYSVSRAPQMDSENSSSEEATLPKTPEVIHPVQEQPPPLPADETYAQIEDPKIPEEHDEGHREYEEEDILDGVDETPDETTGKGSSTLLLTETIPEEDEDEHGYGLPSPRKRHDPVQYVPLRDDNLDEYVDKTEEDNRRSSQPIETDLDAEIVLSPVPRKQEEFGGFAEKIPLASLNDDEALDSTQDVLINQPDHGEEYTETWEDVEPIDRQKKDVRFLPEEDLQQETEISKVISTPEEDEDTHPYSPYSSEEGEVNFDLEGKPQIQSLPEDEVLKIHSTPIPTFDDLLHPQIPIQEEQFSSIREYIPKIRRESTEEDTEDEVVEEEPAEETQQGEFDTTLAINDLNQEEENGGDQEYLYDLQLDPVTENEPKSPDEVEILERLQSTGEMLSPLSVVESTPEVKDQADENETEEAEDDYDLEDGDEMHTTEKTETIKDEVTQPEKKEIIVDDGSKDHEMPPKMPELALPKDRTYRSSAHSLGIDFRVGEPYKSYSSGRSNDRDKIPDYAASTTAATIGDEDDMAIEELDEDIQYEEQPIEGDEDEKISEPSEEDKEQVKSRVTPPGESTSRSTSLSDMTDNTDELLAPNALEKAWSQGAGLDEEDELFCVLFRTPPRRRKHRHRSEINLRDVRQGKQEAMAFRNTIDEDPVSPKRRENLTRRPFVPSWPFNPTSLLDSSDLADLDREAVQAAVDAQRAMLEEERQPHGYLYDAEFSLPSEDALPYAKRRSPEREPSPKFERRQLRGYLYDVDFSFPSEDVLPYDKRRSPEREPSPKSERVLVHPPDDDDDEEIRERVAVRSRSPSASPRMVGEEFIPGVPDFVHSVVPYQLKTPYDSAPDSKATTPTVTPRDPVDPESMKFPDTILKFSPREGKEEPDIYRYSPPADASSSPARQSVPESDDKEVSKLLEPAQGANNTNSAQVHNLVSSGRSTPQSAAENTSEGATSSSNSKSSSSSGFPRFIHSVFPLRRSSSRDDRGRSKTRRKREKKITKPKNKKKPRSKSNEKKTSKKSLPTVEVTSPQDVEAFKGFPIMPPPPDYSSIEQTGSEDPDSQATLDPESLEKTNTANYDQESLDKIILSESDDAHSESGTPETVRRIGSGSPIENECCAEDAPAER